MRLAFAVTAHLEPELFMVNEVLAADDAAFRKKCLGGEWKQRKVKMASAQEQENNYFANLLGQSVAIYPA